MPKERKCMPLEPKPRNVLSSVSEKASKKLTERLVSQFGF